MKKRIHGFTLIELLVVIAIIALLLGILIPSLQKAKEFGTMAVCLNNQRALALGYRLYSGENDDCVPVGIFGTAKGWVANRSDDTLESRIEAVEAGSLFPYLETHKAYHCPGDKRWIRGTVFGGQRHMGDRYQMYVSYTLPISLNNSGGNKKLASIKNPSGSYLFLEDGYDGWSATNATWNFAVGCNNCEQMSLGNPASWRWHDPMGMFHTGGCTMSFVDAHAEKYKWKDRRSKIFFADREDPDYPSIRKHNPQDNNKDIGYMLRRMPEFR